MTEQKFKTAEQARAEMKEKLDALNLNDTSKKPVHDLLLEETREAWIRGKEYGWKKAWNWKRKQAEQGV